MDRSNVFLKRQFQKAAAKIRAAKITTQPMYAYVYDPAGNAHEVRTDIPYELREEDLTELGRILTAELHQVHGTDPNFRIVDAILNSDQEG